MSKIYQGTNKIYDSQDLQDHINNSKVHLPTPSMANQYLISKDGGKTEWIDASRIILDTKTYGVQWTKNQADPHLTRIGNLEYHRTLPIQNKMRGCIAKGTEIQYYLDQNDWNFKENTFIDLGYQYKIANYGFYITQNRENGSTFRLEKRNGSFDPTIQALFEEILTKYGEENWVRIDYQAFRPYMYGKLTKGEDYYLITIHPYTYIPYRLEEGEEIQDKYTTISTRDILNDNQNEAFISGYGQRAYLDGTDGTVQVHVPEFWIKSFTENNMYSVRISPEYIDDTWERSPEMLMDAYPATRLRKSGATLVSEGLIPETSYLATLPQWAPISVINLEDYCCGGEPSLGWRHKSMYSICMPDTTSGKGSCDVSLATMRSNAGLIKRRTCSYKERKNIFYWLYVIEYANFNGREEFDGFPDSNGFRRGGLGQGVQGSFNIENMYAGEIPNGFCNSIGNGTGVIKALVYSYMNQDSGTIVYVPRWRGFDNIFGNYWEKIDGTLIHMDPAMATDTSLSPPIYIIEDFDKFTDNVEQAEANYNRKFYLPRESSYGEGGVVEFQLGDHADIVPASIGNNSVTLEDHKCGGSWMESMEWIGNTAHSYCTTFGGRPDQNTGNIYYFMTDNTQDWVHRIMVIRTCVFLN